MNLLQQLGRRALASMVRVPGPERLPAPSNPHPESPATNELRLINVRADRTLTHPAD